MRADLVSVIADFSFEIVPGRQASELYRHAQEGPSQVFCILVVIFNDAQGVIRVGKGVKLLAPVFEISSLYRGSPGIQAVLYVFFVKNDPEFVPLIQLREIDGPGEYLGKVHGNLEINALFIQHQGKGSPFCDYPAYLQFP